MTVKFANFYDDYDKGTWFISRVDDHGFIVGDVLLDGLSNKQASDAIAAFHVIEAEAAAAERERLQRRLLEGIAKGYRLSWGIISEWLLADPEDAP